MSREEVVRGLVFALVACEGRGDGRNASVYWVLVDSVRGRPGMDGVLNEARRRYRESVRHYSGLDQW